LVGSLARVLFAGLITDRLDREVLAWRFRADVLHSMGGFLELLTAVVQVPGAFLIFACGGNALKAVAALAGMATRANIATSFQASPNPRRKANGAAMRDAEPAGPRSPGSHLQGGNLEDPSVDPPLILDANLKPADADAPASSSSNLADLLAKVDSQGVLAGVVGTALGLVITQTMLLPPVTLFSLYTMGTILQLYLCYRMLGVLHKRKRSF